MTDSFKTIDADTGFADYYPSDNDFPVVSVDSGIAADEASLDPLAGGTAYNKTIWTADRAAAYLNRTSGQWGTGPNDLLQQGGNPGVITFGFHETQASLAQTGYVYVANNAAGVPTYYGLSEYFQFATFNAAQRAATREAIQYWDDVISVKFVETDSFHADINYGNLTKSPNTQAYSRIPTTGLGTLLGGQVVGIAGDVWVSVSQASNFQFDEGLYGLNTLVHETGHSLGLSHPGNYNFGPGFAVNYANGAEYAQDIRNYSIMSYWNPRDVGIQDHDYRLGTIAYGATPMIHDILAAQMMYGADMTTRTGDTVYGFHASADTNGRDAFNFDLTPAPVMAIWDAGGNDTIDASGYTTNQIIDLTPGSLSSIGGVTLADAPTLAQVNANRAIAGYSPLSQVNYNNRMNNLLANPDAGRLVDNVGIAYGAVIENAIGGSGNDTILGNVADNVLTGNAGNDLLASGLGNDTLNGGTGNDTMLGGGGNDLYYVDANGDVVTENANEGTDTVSSSINLTLVANLENLLLTGAAISGSGNGLDNVVTGNGLDNVLSGIAGNDTLVGNGGNDTLDGGAGNDTMIGGTGDDGYVVDAAGDVVTEDANEGTDKVTSSINYTLSVNVENLTLTGAATSGTGNVLDNVITGNALDNTLSGLDGNDTLIGSSGNDLLDGGTGNDVMIGGTGDDTYIVDAKGDVVTEAGSGGTDLVSSSIDYTLGANVENLILTGSATTGTGNELANVITGNALANILSGGLGNDTLYGAGGSDRLFGGAGDDRLVGGNGVDYLTGGAGNDIFRAEINSDTVASKNGPVSLDVIMDFTAGDHIDVSGYGFHWNGNAANKDAGDLSIKTYGNINAAENALGIDIDGVDGPSTLTGPVTVVFGNVDGGAPDFALVLINTSGVSATDFLF